MRISDWSSDVCSSDLKSEKLSRLDRMKKDGIPLQMPSNPMPHIITRLLEIGIAEAGGMASVPISWGEIGAWQRNTGVRLDQWEARLMRKLSSEYVTECRRAESENCPPPWRAEVTQLERDIAEAKLRDRKS